MTPGRFLRILNAFRACFGGTGSASDCHTGQPGSDERSNEFRAPGAEPVASGPAEVLVVQEGQEFVTPLGQRHLQILGCVGIGKRARVYRALEPGSGRTYALKVLHEKTPASLQSMALETTKAAALAAHQLPHSRIVECGATYALKEWIEGVGGDQWLRRWLECGADPSDDAFRALVEFFRTAAGKGVRIDDLKPPNMILQGTTAWVPVDPGLVTAPVPPATTMRFYRDRFVRRWLRASRSPLWFSIYWVWCKTRSGDKSGEGGENKHQPRRQ